MKSLRAVFSLALAVVFISAEAQASTINVTLGATGSDITYGTSAEVISPNIDLTSPTSGLVLDSNAQIINPPATVINQYIQPTGSLYGNSYLAVLGRPLDGSATFTIASGMDDFAFTWGTIDTYNSLTLKDSRNVTYSITGATILSLIAGSKAGVTQSDISFYDLFGSIVTAQLLSSDNSFEAANFSATDSELHTPLPATLPLFGAALLGLAGLRRKKSS